MVRVAAPVMSLEASGSLGGAIVFSTWKGRPYVRSLVTPHNPKSVKQLSVRGMMRFLSQAWDAYGTPMLTTWETLADPKKISPFNGFVAYNLARWRNFKAPSQAYPAAETGTAPSAMVVTPTAGVRCAQLSIADGPNAPDFGIMIFRKLGSAPTPGFDTLVEVLPYVGSPTVWVDTPLTAGTWHYIVRGFLLTAKMGADSTDVNAIVT